ncbi:MAG: uncharacterized protein JWO98_4035 [Frankiales bacterium]|nr:uncharacterized protein [Frankiales bacterium]
METMFASSRRSLPPVPRPTRERAAGPLAAAGPATAAEPVTPAGPDTGSDAGSDGFDPAQEFVSRLRGAAAEFAAAAGAQTAVVREAVPPARHRRSRCRLVLRYAGGNEADLTFLGPAGRPGPETHAGFDSSIQRWLGTGQQREAAWLVPDEDAPDGVAVDVTAWGAAS